jgi:hypothetical protein
MGTGEPIPLDDDPQTRPDSNGRERESQPDLAGFQAARSVGARIATASQA